MAVEHKKVAFEADVVTKALVTVKGDIIAATGSGAVDNLAAGTNDYVLTADSVEATGLKWAAAGAGTVDTSGTPVATDFARFTDADTIEGRDPTEVKTDLGLTIGTDVLAEQTIGIADDNLLEVDHVTTAAATDYARFTANGLEGRDATEAKTDLGLVIGTNVLAEQSIGITDDYLLEVDDVTAAADDIALFTANGLKGEPYGTVAGYLALDDIGVPDAAVDFDLQQATDLVFMTVADEAALPAANVALGQPCWCTAELSLWVCTSAV